MVDADDETGWDTFMSNTEMLLSEEQTLLSAGKGHCAAEKFIGCSGTRVGIEDSS